MRTTLDRFHVGIATEIGPLSLFPVWTEARPARIHRVTPAQGVSVRELEQPTVPQLNVGNDLEVPVLLTEGTLLHGGRQTRVLTHDVLLRAQSRLDVEVACVEQGRWSGGAEHTLNGRVPMRVMATLRDTGAQFHDESRRGERQHRVWANVESYGTRYGRSDTGNLRDLMTGEPKVRRDHEQASHDQRRQHLQRALANYAQHLLPGQSGVLIGALGHPLALEIITAPREFARNVGAMLDALSLDIAGVPSITTPGRRARRWAQYVMDADLAPTAEDATSLSFGTRNDHFTIQTLIEREHHAALHTLIMSTRHELTLAA